jgi:hypothetical protein
MAAEEVRAQLRESGKEGPRRVTLDVFHDGGTRQINEVFDDHVNVCWHDFAGRAQDPART